MNDYINYYDLLGIDKNASNEEIKKAYRNQAKKWHPDLNKDPKAPEMAKKVNEAKEILLDEEKRKDYDIYLENYKNGIFDNLDKRESHTNYNNYEEKTYTKWEYFKLYIKYYNVGIFRKILAIICVLLESLFCLILQGINYIIAYIISSFGYYITYGLMIIAIVLVIIIIVNIVSDANIPINSILAAVGALASLILSMSLEKILNILVYKTPVSISKLNLFLFKKSIGYKN